MSFGSSFSLWEKVRMRVILRYNLSLRSMLRKSPTRRGNFFLMIKK
jgi:hypothetical protein